MKKLYAILILIAFGITATHAQSKGNELMKQAQASLDNKEYVKARYLFLQAYHSFVSAGQTDNAVKCAVNTASLYHRENYYKEAFEVLSRLDGILSETESAKARPRPDLHYPIHKERMAMYLKLKNAAKVREQVARMEEAAKAAKNDSLATDLLYQKANSFYALGLTRDGDAAFNSLVAQSKATEDYDLVDKCYRNLINMAVRANNAPLLGRTYEKYNVWTDSVNALRSSKEYAALQAKYDESLATIADKESTISGKQYIIIALCVLAAVLLGALGLLAVMLLRFIMLTRKQKEAIATANEHNLLKTEFIHNISAQMKPTLDTLDQKHPAVKALRGFSDHIQELSDLENTLTEPLETEEVNMQSFTAGVIDNMGLTGRENMTVDVPKLSMKINREEVQLILCHLLNNAALHTPKGNHISVELKKRGPHTYQYIITDTGCGIAEEQRDNLFKPFTDVRDLTEGDGLGLPICALRATRMNGRLSLDQGYRKGARFILELKG